MFFKQINILQVKKICYIKFPFWVPDCIIKGILSDVFHIFNILKILSDFISYCEERHLVNKGDTKSIDSRETLKHMFDITISGPFY